jgi:ribosomal protein L11 methyltransferase
MKSNKALPNGLFLRTCLLLLVDFSLSFHITVQPAGILRSGRWHLAATVDDTSASSSSSSSSSSSPGADTSSTRNNSNAASTLRSITFRDLHQDQEPQLLGNFLMELGACSTSLTDADVGTATETPCFDEYHPETMTRTPLTTHVWGNCHLTAHFPASADLSWIMEIVRETHFTDLPNYDSVTEVEDKDWVLHVQQSWKPFLLPPFCLRFPWHSDELVQNVIAESGLVSEDGDDFVHLELQGGIAFGTGEHPTTQLCLNWIGQICGGGDKANNTNNMKLMDYGAGSGVLGMAACKLDDTIEAVGVDIDVDAVLIANENCQNNKVGMNNYLSNLVEAQDDESQSVLLKAYYSSKQGQAAEVLPEEWDGAIYDALVANILAAPLVALAPRLTGLLKPGGKLGLSGIMTSQSEMVLEAYEALFDNLQVEQKLGGWVLITGTKKV